jgi:hypothetical protein
VATYLPGLIEDPPLIDPREIDPRETARRVRMYTACALDLVPIATPAAIWARRHPR